MCGVVLTACVHGNWFSYLNRRHKHVATAVGALVVVIIVVVVVVATIAYMMMRKRRLLQQKNLEEPDFLKRYFIILCWHVFLIVIQHLP